MTNVEPRLRPWLRILLAALLVGLFATACGGDDSGDDTSDSGSETTTPTGDTATTADPATPVAGGEATVLLYSEIGTLDPVKMTGSGGSDGQRAFALYGALVALDPVEDEVTPVLAESFEPSADLLTWTLKMKPDVVMTDGTPYDAAAVKANWDRIKDVANRSPSLTTLLQVATMEITDPLTLTLTLSAPNAHFDKAIARVGASYIASAKALADKTDLTSTAVGAGPFVLDEWLRDDHMTMTKNPDWKGSEGPYLDTLTFRVVGDEDQRIDTYITGDADAFYTATRASVIRGQEEVDGSGYVGTEVTSGQAFVFNTTKPPFNDVRMRTAFVQAVDWQAMADAVFGEGAEALTNFTIEGTPWYDEKATLPEYDVPAAQALIDDYIADNGGGPLVINYTAFQQSLDQARAEFIQTSIGQLENVSMEVQVGDSPTNIQKVLAADYMVASWGFPTQDPEPGLYYGTYSKSFNNYSKYNNPDVDALLDQARVLTDVTARKALYDQVWEILAKDIPYYPYVKTNNGFVTSPDLHGAEVYEDGILRVDLLWKSA
jgi:peptide/nickel transport system substrate-binding protein